MIVFRNATKQFSNDSYGIKDVSFEVPGGGFLFVTGKSGSGKTTLMKLLTREYALTAGEITVGDIQLSQLKKSKVYQHRRNIGIVYQDYLLLPDLNVWENIALPLSVHGRSSDDIESRVTDLLKLVKLTDKAFSFPSELSGGEAQRISIARALATGPKIIFADEPTGNLDAENTRHIAALLKKIHELGTTVICATHDPSLLELITAADHVVLEKGIVKDKKLAQASEHKKTKVEKQDEKSEKKSAEQKKEDKKQPAEEDQDLEITVEPIVVEDLEISESDLDSDANSKTEEKERPKPQNTKETAEKTSWWSKLFGKKKTQSAAKQTDTSKKSSNSEEPKSEAKKSETNKSETNKSEHKKADTTEDKKTSDHKKHESKEDKHSKDAESNKKAEKPDQADKSDTKDSTSKKK